MAAKVSNLQAKAFKRDGYPAVKGSVYAPASFKRLLAFSKEKFAEQAARSERRAPSLIDCPH